ncbi:MAG: hypothetical protein M0R38_11360 [Bacteroidia bacterium]|nr:hypothetical protein [Bacteroidia bacterium]
MRDIKRIPITIDKLQKVWEKYPDLRFGQLASFIFQEAENITTMDPFFIEEQHWNEVLDKIMSDT